MRKFAALILALLIASPSMAQDTSPATDDSAALAEKLSNPVSNLISVPFQFNYDCCIGPRGGSRVLLNIQPVIPFSISDDWTLIMRTIMPILAQEETVAGGGSHFGLGDISQSFFFSPKDSGGIIWGVGPDLVWNTSTDPNLGGGKWAAGPTGVILKQSHGWTYGMLASHVWSFAGQSSRVSYANTFLQPFVGYTWPDTTGISVNTETTYSWYAQTWNVPINIALSHVYKFGKQPVSLQLGGRYSATTPNGQGPDWGARFNVVFLFPA
jgi:hypothetical protein